MPQKSLFNHKIIMPGTQVVTLVSVQDENGKILHPQGAVAVITRVQTDDNYQLRFLDGYETTLPRQKLMIRKQYQSAGLLAQTEETPPYYDYIIYRCVVGSQAFGLDQVGSDVDRRGIYLPPADLHWSLYGLPEQLENHETQTCYWELQKFITLALKANPNILECLYTPLVEYATPLAEALRAQREMFLSQLVYQTYNGYVTSQFKKMKKHQELYGKIRWKHAMHLIRLLLSGITILQTGAVMVKVDNHRDELLAIRRGEWRWDEVNQWRLALQRQFDTALTQTTLPARPDYDAANRFLIEARRQMV